MSGGAGLTVEQIQELVNIHARPPDQIPKGSFPDFTVVWNREIEGDPLLPQNHVTAGLSKERPSKTLEHPHRISAGDYRQTGHLSGDRGRHLNGNDLHGHRVTFP